jgi:hypothetical protein
MFICSGVSITSDITGTKQIGFSFILCKPFVDDV